jgi:uncharacterized protein YjcR
MNKLIPSVEFKSVEYQELAKAAFHKRLSELSFMYSLDTVTLEQTAKMAGVSINTIERWNGTEGWAAWFFNHDTPELKVSAIREIAVNNLRRILHSPLGDGKDGTISTKDMLKAIEMVFEVGDMMPNKRKEVTFIDKDLNKMQDEEVEAEMKKVRSKLAPKALT